MMPHKYSAKISLYCPPTTICKSVNFHIDHHHKMKKISHKVSIVMGSNSDYSTMKLCEKILRILEVNYETNIVSAHRTPLRMFRFAKSAENRNISVIIAGAGGSAHLPGMIASLTRIPV